MCNSAGLATAAEITVVDTKLAEKHLSTPEFKYFNVLSMLSWVRMKSFLGKKLKDEQSPNTHTNHHIVLMRITIMVYYLLQELRSWNLCANQHMNRNSLLSWRGKGGINHVHWYQRSLLPKWFHSADNIGRKKTSYLRLKSGINTGQTT